jgi:hypothetical protein
MSKHLTFAAMRSIGLWLQAVSVPTKRISVVLAVTLLGTAGSIQAPVQAQQPPISDPGNRAPAGSMPGAWPLCVTSANVNAAPIPGSRLGGPNSDNLFVSFPSSGPIAWTESRHNEGDIAMLIGPFDPNDPSYYPPANFVNDYKPLEGGQPFANTTLAWRVNQQLGALLATARTNGVDNGDFLGNIPVGITHGIAYFNADFGQGWGYRMTDGVFANGGDFSSDLQIGIAGFDNGLGEATVNTAVSFFPYSEGWLGGWVNDGAEGTGAFSSISPNLDPSVVTYTGGLASVLLPNIDSSSDGMLFVAPTSSNNSTNIAAAFPNALGGWNVTIRRDNDDDFSGQTANFGTGNRFQFLYVPYSARNLVGGHVSGSDGSLINSAGNNRFSISRTQAGEYALSVFATDGVTKLTEDDGTVILSVAANLPGSTTLADRKFMSYQFDPVSGDFIIQSRELVAKNSPNSQNVFGDELALRDVNFYFTFLDFNDPVSMMPLGDANGDGFLDFGDLEPFVLALQDPEAHAAQYPNVNVNKVLDFDGDDMFSFGDIEGFVNALLGN